MIEDQELSMLFRVESEEHLQKLDEGLLSLEANPKDAAVLEEVFREAHSLKGAARMLGVMDVETIAHHFEDTLGGARRGTTVLTSDILDRLYQGLDSIRKLVHGAVTGDPVSVDVEHALARLRGEVALEGSAHRNPSAAAGLPVLQSAEADPQGSEVVDDSLDSSVASAMRPVPEVNRGAIVLERDRTERFPSLGSEPSEGVVAIAVQETSLRVEEVPARQVEVEADPRSSAFKIETIRVEHQKLDELMTLAGELTVMAGRNARRFAEFEEILTLWEEFNRESQANRSLHHVAETNPGNAVLANLVKSYQRQREWLERLGSLLNQFRNVSIEDITRLEFVANELEEAITKVRLLPLAMVFNLFPRMVRDLARAQNKEVQILIEGGDTTADKRIIQEMKDPLMHMIRNAIDHGIESPDDRVRLGKPRRATLWLRSYHTETNIIVEIQDDGRGLNVTALRQTALRRGIVQEEDLNAMTPDQVQALIFAPGFSTSSLVTDMSGRGVGLDVVRENVESLKGSIRVESAPGLGCTFRLQLPMTLATTRVLLVEVERRPYAVPVDFVKGTLRVSNQEVFFIEGRETIVVEGQPVSIARLADLLELRNHTQSEIRNPKSEIVSQPCLILTVGEEQLGLLVDGLLDEQEIVLKPLSGLLKRVRNVSGATILGTGEVCTVLNPQDLMRTVRKQGTPVVRAQETGKVETKRNLLLVDDSITTRTQMKRILEGAGYEVAVAVDGLDGLNKLSSRTFDAVVADVQMPNMDGFTMTGKIRQDPRNQDLPILIVTSLASDEDKRRGVEVGANAYITKGTFDQKVLLDTLRRLV